MFEITSIFCLYLWQNSGIDVAALTIWYFFSLTSEPHYGVSVMKKTLCLLGLILVFAIFIASPASADLMMGETTTQELQDEYGSSGDDAVEAWANGIIGDDYIFSPHVDYTVEQGEAIKEQSAGDGYDPELKWDYLVAKAGNRLILIYDDNEDDLLQFDDFGKTVSNIRYDPVSEPAVVLLLAVGIVGLFVLRNKFM